MAELARSDSPAGTATDVKRARVAGLQPTRSMPLMCSLSAARRRVERKEPIARNRCMHRTRRFRRAATGGRWPRPRSTRRLTATWRARAPPLGTVCRHCPVRASLEPVKRASPAIGATLRCHWGVHFAELRQEGPPLNDCEVRLPSYGQQFIPMPRSEDRPHSLFSFRRRRREPRCLSFALRSRRNAAFQLFKPLRHTDSRAASCLDDHFQRLRIGRVREGVVSLQNLAHPETVRDELPCVDALGLHRFQQHRDRHRVDQAGRDGHVV